MVSVFYIASIITILASIKVISCTRSINALIYFVVSLLSTSVVFYIMGAYFSAALVVVLSVGAVSLFFLSVISLLKLRKDTVDDKKGISPKIWLGPLILTFVLFVSLVYGIVGTDYLVLQATKNENIEISDLLFGAYILVVELAVLLLLGALVIAYHFIHRIYGSDKNHQSVEKTGNVEQMDNNEERLPS